MSYLVAIPVFNEEAYLAEVLTEVRRFADRILVIDDGSTDATPDILARQTDVQRIRHLENRGYGQSLISAFDFAMRRGFDWLITIDCDRQHEPALIPGFLEQTRTTHADVISGSRYLRRRRDEDTPPADRREINHYITELLNETLGLNITDAFCGFKAYRVRALKQLNITVPGYAMPLQLWVQVARRSLPVVELPVKLIYHDPNRHFGGLLDDPSERLTHYLEVLVRELAADERPAPADRARITRSSAPRLCRATDERC